MEKIDESVGSSIQQLAEHTQIVPKFAFQYGLEKGHVESDKVVTSNNLHTTVEMVIAQIGWSIVPEFVVRQLTDEQSIVPFHIEGSVPVVWSAEIIYPSDDKLTLAGDIFIQHVQLLNGAMD